ncbi:MAG: Cys-tRNA(Pro) deacylase [Clostridia bacterium]|nr:Cys-tRNA(Pro) deacylase [Clostridia bacterium]
MSKLVKTNAMRQLDAAKIPYTVCSYEVDENDLSGTHIADQLGLPYEQVFKTIVTRGDKTGYLVFCIPCHKEIDLKRAAAVTGNKRIEPVQVKELLGLTGYIRGGCSPVGMKKKFPTYFDQSAEGLEKLTVSAGVRGMQLLLRREDILSFTGAVIGDVTAK